MSTSISSCSLALHTDRVHVHHSRPVTPRDEHATARDAHLIRLIRCTLSQVWDRYAQGEWRLALPFAGFFVSSELGFLLLFFLLLLAEVLDRVWLRYQCILVWLRSCGLVLFASFITFFFFFLCFVLFFATACMLG